MLAQRIHLGVDVHDALARRGVRFTARRPPTKSPLGAREASDVDPLLTNYDSGVVRAPTRRRRGQPRRGRRDDTTRARARRWGLNSARRGGKLNPPVEA